MPRDLFSTGQKSIIQQNGSSQDQSNQGNDFLSSMASSAPVQGILGAGDAVRNMMSLGYLNQPSGSGTAYNIGNIAGNIGGFLGGGEALDAARAAGEALPILGSSLQKLGGSNLLPSMLRRITGSAIGGADENADNRSGGAIMGGAMGAAGEAIPLGFNGLSKLSELITPKNYAKQLGDEIQKNYNLATNEASKYYDPVLDTFGNYRINIANPSKEFKNLGSDIYKYFTPKINKLYDDYNSKPTFENAHELQSQLETESRNLQTRDPDAFTQSSIQALRMARGSLLTDMRSFLQTRNPLLADSYQTGADLFKQNVAPYRANSSIFNIAQGKYNDIDPKQLQKSLSKLTSNNNMSEDHFLNQAYSDLTQKLNKGKIIGTGAAMLGGMAGAGLLGNEIGGAPTAGALGLAGAVGGKFLAPSIMDLATNPEMAKLATNISPYYQNLVKGIVSNKLQGT